MQNLVIFQGAFYANQATFGITQGYGHDGPASLFRNEECFIRIALGRLAGVTDPNGNQTTYTIDGLGNMTQKSSPDTGITSFTHNDAGQVITKTVADGTVTTYSYDALSRITGMSFPDSSQNITYGYDNGTTGKGKLTSMNDPSGSYAYTYDTRGLLSQTSKTILTVQYDTSYTYDDDGKLATITYPSGRVVQYVRDSMGRVTSILTGGGSVIVVQNVTRLPFGPVNAMNHGNGLSLARTYSQDYWLNSQTVGTLIDLGYTRDNMGHITAITDNLNSANNQSFTYDDLYRLLSATGNYGTKAYTYDLVGNRLTKTVNGQLDTYIYQTGTNKLASITGQNPDTLTPDANGNITVQGSKALTYNQNQRLIRAVVGGSTQTDYTVNGKGRRIIKTTASDIIVYHYDKGGRLIAETDDTGTLIKEYIWLGRELMAVVESGGVNHVHSSHRLEPLKVTDSSGTVVWDSTSQKPFGGTGVDEDPDGNGVNFTLNVRLPGQYFDAETGYHYNYFRDYYPVVGRYLQADPIGLTSGVNLYIYTNGNPMNMIDILGLDYLEIISTPAFSIMGYDWGLNHVSVRDPKTGQMHTGMGGSSGYRFSANDTYPEEVIAKAEKRRVELPDGMIASEVIKSIGYYPGWDDYPYCPYFNDCHAQLERAFNYAGIDYPGSPNGRFDYDEYLEGAIDRIADDIESIIDSVTDFYSDIGDAFWGNDDDTGDSSSSFGGGSIGEDDDMYDGPEY